MSRTTLVRIALPLCGEAARALLRHRVRSALAMIGIAIGIAATVWVVAIGQAGTERAEYLLGELGDNLVWVEAGSRNVAGVRTGTHGTTSLTLDDAQAIAEEISTIERVSPQVDGTALVVGAQSNWTTRWRGVAPDYLSIKRWRIAAGDAFTTDDVDNARNVCLLGQTVRRQVFGDADAVGQVVRVGGQPFVVVGVLAAKGQSGSGQDQDDCIMVPYTTAQQKLRRPRARWVDDVVCSAGSAEAIAPAAKRITDLMRQRHRIAPGDDDDFNIRHPEELVKAQLETSRTFATLLLTIAFVSLVVGGIGIMNVMLASVAERTREIGIRLALGATPRAVMFQFLVESTMLCSLGGAAGGLASVAGASAIGKTLGWPLAVHPSALLLSLAFAVAVGLVFGIVPARHAAGLDPIEALRSE